MEKKIGGVIPPVLTAFNKSGALDEKAQRDIVSFLIEHVQGFFICGTYGSGPLMSAEERKRVAEVIVDEVGGRVPVIVHVGAAATSTVVELARHAEAIGATAVAAVPPIYYGFKEPEVLRYFQELLDAVSIPVFVYNNPKTSGVAVTADLLNRLTQLGVAGVKDSSFDIMVFYSYLVKVKKKDFIPIIGTEALALPALVMGAHGVVSGLANALPEPVVELVNAVQSGDLQRAAALQIKVFKMREIMHLAPSLPMIQAILRARGVNAGYPRSPFALPEDTILNKALAEFRDLGYPVRG
jgi:dihydrodipicolinate synthase/N-acetylneuraminate lyase|uniref:Dihydrodipicolinate synthase family protein n=1 Tax=Candidatus Methanosuratincola petrocarbonis (ex Vanwonterghem et al. 2016) TaxID=1867261 RepID=A0A7J3UZC1_9CREN